MASKKITSPTIDFVSLCERYFYKTPAFFNLDLEGSGAYAILQNNWENPLCRPEVISVEVNRWNEIAGFRDLKRLIESKGYKGIK